MVVFNTFLVAVLEFVAQLCIPTEDAQAAMTEAMRTWASGPGNWCTLADLENLHLLGLHSARTIDATAKAAKLRVLHRACPDARRMWHELRCVQMESIHRPLGAWHRHSFVEVLVENEDSLQECGITRNKIDQAKSEKQRFQHVARGMIVNPARSLTTMTERVRHKLGRWKLDAPLGILIQRAFRNYPILMRNCRPCIVAMQWRTMWNGWPTSARMRSLTATDTEPCLLGCRSGSDRIEHYAVCAKAWELLGAREPVGLGLNTRLRSLLAFLGLERDLSEAERRRLATGVYAVARTVQTMRSQRTSLEPWPILKWYANTR